jgi:uncharacterized Zn finger protein
MSFGFEWRPYVSVAERRLRAEREIAKLRKKGRAIAPVTIEGRKITKNFWGQSWCMNLERYSDFASRLPRGRSYVCNGLVIDLQISKGQIIAIVSGSELYDVKVTIAPVTRPRWKAICRDCAGSIDSLVELLQGRLAKGVMDRVCREGDGLFPAPGEIKLSCSCLDWADMCKHVAAVLYGVGARLDEQPQLLFVLRGADETELLAGAGEGLVESKPAPLAGNVLDDGEVAALFGLELAEGAVAEIPVVTISKPSRRAKTMKVARSAARTITQAKHDQPHRKRAAAGSPPKAKVSFRKKRAGDIPSGGRRGRRAG